MVRVSEVRMGAGEMPQAAIFPSKRPDGKHWDRPKIWGPKTKVGYYGGRIGLLFLGSILTTIVYKRAQYAREFDETDRQVALLKAVLERQGKTVADVVPVYRRVPVVSEPEENHMEDQRLG